MFAYGEKVIKEAGMEKEAEELVVMISRAPSDHKCGEIKVTEIRNVQWDDTSGGVHQTQGGYSLYGYIPYGKGKELVACSGRHDRGYNDIKICIPKSKNRDERHKKGYEYLFKQAGDKPKSKVMRNRPEDAPPCTKRILQILDAKGDMYRKELRETLTMEGYQMSTIRRAVKDLSKQEKIALRGSSWSAKQTISRNNIKAEK